MHSNKTTIYHGALALMAWLPLTAVAGGALDMLQDKTVLQLGGYRPKIDSGVSIRSNSGPQGAQIDMESDLGMADTQVSPWLTANYRFADRHRLGFSYFHLNRNASHALERTLTIGSETYDVGLQAHSQLDIDVSMLDYNYLFAKAENYEGFISAGLHRIAVNTQFEIDASASNDNGGQSVAREGTRRSVNAPLPVVGIGGTYVINDTWAVIGNVRYFSLKLDQLDGSLNVLEAALQYHPWRNVGLSLGYTFDRLNVDMSKEKWTGSLRYDFKGATFAVISHF